MGENEKNPAKQNQKPQEKSTKDHKWDEISEYNIGAPRWWLIVWIVSIIWSIGYWVVYPTWPTISGHTKGILNWSSSSDLNANQARFQALHDKYGEEFKKLRFQEILNNPQMMEYAISAGSNVFAENCAACHGSGAAGGKGFPNLNDDDWVWGGKIEDIFNTIKYGVRSGEEKAHFSQMPAFGVDQVLKPEEIEAVAQYVLSLSDKNYIKERRTGAGPASREPLEEGKKIFKAQCSSCHGIEGKGSRELGAPNLTDGIWLYGGSKEDVVQSITYSRAGVMPAWGKRFDDDTIRKLAIFVYSRGGGE